jgi:hypothetical protein
MVHSALVDLVYLDRVLRGERPTDLPVQQPTKFQYVIHLKTAGSLDFTVTLTMQMTESRRSQIANVSPHMRELPLEPQEACLGGSVPSCARLSHKRTANLTRDVEEPADKSLPVAHGNDVATQPSVKAETAAGALESEQEH